MHHRIPQTHWNSTRRPYGLYIKSQTTILITTANTWYNNPTHGNEKEPNKKREKKAAAEHTQAKLKSNENLILPKEKTWAFIRVRALKGL